MNTLYCTFGGVVFALVLVYGIYKLAQRAERNKIKNELLKIRAEKHKRDQDIIAKSFVDDPLDVLRKSAK